MALTSYATYAATVPAALVYPGLVKYWLVLRQKDRTRTFPGGFASQPGDWDYARTEHWEVPVVAAGAPLPLFSAGADKDLVEAHGLGPNAWADYVTTPTGALALRRVPGHARRRGLRRRRARERHRLAGRARAAD